MDELEVECANAGALFRNGALRIGLSGEMRQVPTFSRPTLFDTFSKKKSHTQSLKTDLGESCSKGSGVSESSSCSISRSE